MQEIGSTFIVLNVLERSILMTKKEKEILHWIIDRSWEKKANPVMIAELLVQLFPDNLKEVSKELDEAKKCDKVS